MAKKKAEKVETAPRGVSKKKQVLDFIHGLSTDEESAPTVEIILTYMREVGFIPKPKIPLTEALSKEQVAWAKVTFITEAAEIEGLSDEMIANVAGVAAAKGVEDPSETKLFRIAKGLGAETIEVLFKQWILNKYKEIAEGGDED